MLRDFRETRAGAEVAGDPDETSGGAWPEHDIDHAVSRAAISGHVPGERQPAGLLDSHVAADMMQYMAVAADREAEPAANDRIGAQAEELVAGKHPLPELGRVEPGGEHGAGGMRQVACGNRTHRRAHGVSITVVAGSVVWLPSASVHARVVPAR